ncbi:MAG TPA: carboxymuconolactone decarboxylase family protein [Chloroflexota bacterium]|nr:carboxymuconolactone decarboxylase family protein [Chloroflexota bacterium]
MSRLPAPTRDSLNADAQAIWDRIAAARTGGMRGPSSILMNIPTLADRVDRIEEYFRNQAELPAPDRELIILATVREMGARFAWARHEVRAQNAGTRKEAVEVLRQQGPTDALTPRERVIVDTVRTLSRTKSLPKEQFDQALKALGQRQLIELVTLMGQYSLIGFVIQAFEIPEESPTF